MRHHFTVDVEEFFHSSALVDRVSPSQWDAYPRRAPEVVAWLLDLMAHHDARGTFFVLGWMADREPAMVRAIAEAGHEVAGHSWDHRTVPTQTPDEFRDSMRRTKQVLEDLTGHAVAGFRAPSFSVVPGQEWALDVLLEEGYAYDSSLFPITQHPDYGYPDAPSDPHLIRCASGQIAEFPPLTLAFAGRRFPAAGGAYLRFLPSALVRRGLRQAEGRGSPGTLYIHPWDLDPDVERLSLPPLLSLRLHGGSRRARRRVDGLLGAYRFAPIRETMEAMWPSAA